MYTSFPASRPIPEERSSLGLVTVLCGLLPGEERYEISDFFYKKRFLPCDQVSGFSDPVKGRVGVHTYCGTSEIWFKDIHL